MIDKRCSIWHFIAGLIMLVLGIMIWANPAASLLAMALYFGLILFLLGCGYVIFALSQYSGWYMIVGLFDIFIGLIFMTNLGLTVETLPIFFALWILVSGIVQIAGSIEVRKSGQPWGWALTSGIIGIVVAYFILTSQELGDWALVLTAGTYTVVYGIINIAEYFYFRHFCKLTEEKA